MTPKDLPELTGVQAFQNTDREVWRETPGDFYSNSVHLTATGGLGINVGGTVYVKPPAEWHRLASGARSTAAQPVEPSAAPRRTTGWVAPKDRYVPPVLFNPYTGEPRNVRDVQSDPQGVLIVPPGALMLAAPPAASGDSTPASLEVHMDREHGGLAFGKGDPSGALRPEPEAVGQGRWWRKKPVVIEAFQWNGLESGCQAAKARFPELETSSKSGHLRRPEVTSWHIRTLEGHMRVSPGDWIVRGVAGEFYPCKPDIFAATYEPAEPPQAASVERGD